ncbi:MAG TPA: lysylphosphatidylglycerol synthase domain-containing protein [Allosphingosinicella sp.]|jgi:hypothetical protein
MRLGKRLPLFWLAGASAIVFLAVIGLSLVTQDKADLHGSERIGLLLLAGLLYLASHLMRALRLAIIATPMIGLSFRTGVYLHFFVAPWSLLLPLKTDELIRLHELGRAGRAWTRAVLVVLIDRSMDGLVLVALSIYLLRMGHTDVASFTGVLGVGLTALVIAFLILPVLLESAQRHIFTNHYGDYAVRLLRWVSYLRGLLTVARQTIHRVLPFLALSTIAIWSIELAAVYAALSAVGTDMPSFVVPTEAMVTRAGESWRMLLGGGASELGQTSRIFFLFLLAVWPFAYFGYRRRNRVEPSRARLRASGQGERVDREEAA